MTFRVKSAQYSFRKLPLRSPFAAKRGPFFEIDMTVLFEFGSNSYEGKTSDTVSPDWLLGPLAEEAKSCDFEVSFAKTIDQVVQLSQESWGTSVFGFWLQLEDKAALLAERTGGEALEFQLACALIERSLVDAYCNARQKSFAELLKANAFGIDFNLARKELKGHKIGEYLPEMPSTRLAVCHTVEMGDPLLSSESEFSLESAIEAYGLRYFRFLLSGDPAVDVEWLRCVLAVIVAKAGSRFHVVFDGRERFKTVADLKQFWDALTEDPQLKSMVRRVKAFEQPFAREVALSNDVLGLFAEWPKRPPILADASDASLDGMTDALRHGYAGASYRASKGLFKNILNRCLLTARKEREPVGKFTMSGGSHAMTSPVGLLQDLVVQAVMGKEFVALSVHHYAENWGASEGKGALNIEDGSINVSELMSRPFGREV